MLVPMVLSDHALSPLCVQYQNSGTGARCPPQPGNSAPGLRSTERGRLPFLALCRLRRCPVFWRDGEWAVAVRCPAVLLSSQDSSWGLIAPLSHGMGPFLLEPGMELLFLALTWWCLCGASDQHLLRQPGRLCFQQLTACDLRLENMPRGGKLVAQRAEEPAWVGGDWKVWWLRAITEKCVFAPCAVPVSGRA